MGFLNTCRLLAFTFSGIIATSCCNDADLKIDSSLKGWVPYQQQQEIKFRSDVGDTLIFSALVKDYYQQGSDEACGAYDIQTKEVTLISPSDPNFKTIIQVSHEIVVSIKTIHQETNTASLDIKFNTVSEEFISFDWRDKYLKDYQLAGNKYGQLLYAYGNPIPGNLAFTDFLYAKDYGLVGFKTFDNKWYSLIIN